MAAAAASRYAVRLVNIVHLELGRYVYGGAEQVRYLLRGLRDDAHQHTLICSAGSDLHRWAESAGQPVVALTFGGEHDLAFVLRLIKALGVLNADLLHVHSRRGADWMGALASWRLGIPAVLSRRVDHVPGRWLRWLMSAGYARTIAISQTIADLLVLHGVDAERLLTIHSSVHWQETDEARARELLTDVLGSPSRGPVIGVVAQLIERKGHRFVIEALPAWLRKTPDLRVVFFGRGPLRAELEEQVRAAGLQAHVVFAGFRDDLDAMLRALTLVVHPALREGLGVSLLKAAAAGVPVVGFRAGGVTEVVVDEHTGLLVPTEDVLALTAAVARLLDNPPLRLQFGDNARHHVADTFSASVMVQRHAALYDVLAQEHA